MISEFLLLKSSIIELYLLGNQIGNAGASALGKALKLNSSIRKFNIANNQIEDGRSSETAKAHRG
eukprot:TRINITY_DN843_c0_g1_i2.p1 TRINITY_DN843_c0_g1~~TRINITY_DN843_c0_g1_i2.p1  ORF type:complete len:74 (+),score=21.69 TRINITY_DN843_c0_g1_i2:29-223(+)